MRKDVTLQQERGERILLVAAQYPADFAGAVPVAAIAQIQAGVSALQLLPADQKTGTDSAIGATTARRTLIDGMMKQLRALRRTFDQVKKRDASISGQLNLPSDEKDDTIVAAARAAITLLTPLVPKFVARGKNPDFLDELNADIAAFDTLTTSQQSGQMQSTGATSQIEATVKSLVDAYEDLDDFVENKWENEPEKLAQWHRAEKLGKMARNPGNATPVVKPTP
jgi:hypothetical protein